MRYFLCAVVFLGNLTLFAQDAPKAEVFAGFSFANYELIGPAQAFSASNETISGSSAGRLTLFGWNGSVAVDMNRWFSFATDFSGYYSGSSTSTTSTTTISINCGSVSCPAQTITTKNVAASPKIHNFLLGPQFSYPGRKVRPFGHLLIGEERLDVTRAVIETGTPAGIEVIGLPVSPGSNEFAMAIGGGVDYLVKHNLAWRLAADYLTAEGSNQNHVRVSMGLVWRLGR
jgi:opacity protein-like surface antigen